MKKILKSLHFSKRQKFVIAVFFLSLLLFISEYFTGDIRGLIIGITLSALTSLSLFLILRNDIKGTFFYPILLLPFLYTLSFNLFYSLIPPRFLTRIIITTVYAIGLYSLFLSHNIFAVSATRTINLLRSARVVSFIITVLVVFFFINIIFTLRYPIPITTTLIFILVFILNFQFLWLHNLDNTNIKQLLIFSTFNSLALAELSIILTIWPVNATIYSIFLSGMFYTYSGLSHAWIEKRLFKGILWEYVWVAFLSILILIAFSRWGI